MRNQTPESAEPRRVRIGRSLAVVAALVLLFFGAWEWIERWAGWDERVPSAVHALHLVRGVGAALVAAALVAWLIGQASPPLTGAQPRDDAQWWERGQFTAEQWARSYGRWFIVMRWIAIAVSAALIFLATHVSDVLPHEMWIPLSIPIVVLAACNVGYEVLLRRRMWLDQLLAIQIAVDLMALAVLLHFSGGVENPLSLLMVFHVIIAGIILDRSKCFITAAGAAALYALLALGEWSGVLPHYTLYTFPHVGHEHGVPHAAHFTPYVMSSVVVHAVVLLLTAYFVTTLRERVLYDERELAAMAERALAQQQLLERAMETTGTGLRVLDQQLRPFWLNEQWKKLLPARDGERDDLVASRTLADGQVRFTEVAESEGSLGRRVLQLTTAPLYNKSNQIIQVVELAQDVTRQREAQERLIRSSRLAAMGELAAEVAHEVNNPIGIVCAKARILLNSHRSEMSEHVAAELEKITTQADRVARVAQGLLTYCRSAEPARVSAGLATAVKRAVDLVEQRARAARVQIEKQLPSDLPPARANLDEMEQVLCNLLLNAIDAMRDGGRITIAGRFDRDNVEVSVQDTGCGMPPQVRQRVFEPFFTTKKREGTGLGLSICQGLVTASGGIIEVESEVGRGSTFTVRLPISQVQQASEAKDG